ncbi:MAG: hypothetical protein ABEK59_09675 [Halobacteria archaeon]
MTSDEEENDYYRDKLTELDDRVDGLREEFDGPYDHPRSDLADRCLQECFGPIVSLYVESRTGGTFIHYDQEEFDRIERVMNDSLEVYVGCYGHDHRPDCSIRPAGKLMMETRSARVTAENLTKVP